MRSLLGGVLAGAICLLASAAAAEVSGTIVAESDRDFSQPHDLVLSADGAFLYVADVGNDRIKVLDPTTLATLGTFAAGQLSGPHDVAFDRQGRLLVADTHNHRIAIYEVDGASGVFVGAIGDPLRKPEGVDVAADGTIYVTSASLHTVTKIRDGAVVGEVGGGGGGDNRYSRPHDIEAARGGRVVVADPGNDRLQILDADLGFLRTVGGPEFGFNEPNRLCTWLRFDQHAVGKGFCIGGEAEERAESSVAGFAAVEAKDELIEIGLQMLATQPVVDASRPSFEVGEDLVDPRQDEVSGGLPDDMDIVAIGGDRSVAGPAVGFRDGVGIGGGFDEVSEVGGAVGGDFGQPQAAWDVSVPEFDGADDEHLAVVAASLPSGGRIVFGPEWKAGLVDFHQARQRVALGVDHAGAQLVGEQPSAAVRADTELFLELQGRDAVGVGRHQVGGPEPDGERQLAGVQDRPGRHRGLPAAAGALEGVCFSAQRPSLFMAARGTDEAVRPAHFDQPGGAGVIVREHVLEGEEAVGDLFHVVAPSAGTYKEHSTRSPALTSTSTSGGKLSRPEPCA